MPRSPTFPDSVTVKELKILIPLDKLEALKDIAATHGLNVTSYVRSMLYTHVARVSKDGGKS